MLSKEHEKSLDKAKSKEVDVETEVNSLLQELFKCFFGKRNIYQRNLDIGLAT